MDSRFVGPPQLKLRFPKRETLVDLKVPRSNLELVSKFQVHLFEEKIGFEMFIRKQQERRSEKKSYANRIKDNDI